MLLVAERRREMSVTTVLIIINVLVYILPFVVVFGDSRDSSFLNFISLGWEEKNAIYQGQLYRLITSIFLHGSLIHLFVNMYSLESLGFTVERIFGKLSFLTIYMLSGVCGGLTSIFFSSDRPSVGASGAIFGLAGTLLAFSIHHKDKRMIQGSLSVIAINLIIGLTSANINNWAHLGGLVCGFLVGWLFLKNE